MGILSWGKPKLEIVETLDGAVPASPVWVTLPTSKDKTSQLTTEKGEKLEALGEGGELVASKFSKNKYTFATEIFVKKGDTQPIADDDGVITKNYCLRLTPEDTTVPGWIMENTSVTADVTWSSDQGQMLKYTFTALKPKTGAMLKPYTAS